MTTEHEIRTGFAQRKERFYEDVASEIADGRRLRCTYCNLTMRIDAIDAALYLRGGWPRCCGYTMRLEAE